EHGADPGDGEEDEQVLGAVDEPETDVVARLDAGRDEPLRHTIGLFAELGEGPPPSFEAERLTVSPTFGGAVQELTERLLFEPHGGLSLQRNSSSTEVAGGAPSRLPEGVVGSGRRAARSAVRSESPSRPATAAAMPA